MMKIRDVFTLYKKALAQRPYLVQAVQTGTLMGAGDLISQTVIEKKSFKQVDFLRTMRFSSIGFFIGGPALRFWYGLLSRKIGDGGKAVAMKKVFIDQGIFAPAFLFILLVTVGTTQGKDWNSIKHDISLNYLDILKTNYYIWPWVQIVNFYYTPLQYQVLVVQCVALFWNTYLAWKTNKSHDLEVKSRF